MGKIIIMHVLCMGTYSGAENVAITLISSLKEKVNSVYVSPDGPIRKVVQQNGIRHYAIEKIDIKNIRNAIREIKPDVIHAHDFAAGFMCALVAGNIPIINHLHNNASWIKRIGIKSIIYYLSCFRYQKILTVSDAIMDEFVFGKYFRKKTMVVGNPIDLSAIREKADMAQLNEESDVLFLGRLMPPKNPLLFVDIVAEVVKKVPKIKVAMVGEGELRQEVEVRIKQHSISGNVKIYGFQENPYGLVKHTKLLCIPSIWEGFGLAAVEGLSLGKPVVAANVGGLPKIVNNLCGKLCNDKDEYVSEICKLLLNEEYLKEKATEAFERAKEFDNINQYSDSILDIYKITIGV